MNEDVTQEVDLAIDDGFVGFKCKQNENGAVVALSTVEQICSGSKNPISR